ncbi:MAG TPA: hypothetical protein VE621_21975, partial [Bryobacteraceae bacterium]|nr:hypothetical protein [Bryobacteraceae bacterium]
PSPMYAPETVAEAILYAAQHPTRDLLVGDTAPVQSFLGRVTPRLGDKYLEATMFQGQQSQRTPEPGDNRALHEPSSDLRERGNYDARTFEKSLYTKAVMNSMFSGVLALGAGLAIGGLIRNSGKVPTRN